MCIAISINDVNIIRYLKAEKRKQGGHFLFLHIDTSYIVARICLSISHRKEISLDSALLHVSLDQVISQQGSARMEMPFLIS